MIKKILLIIVATLMVATFAFANTTDSPAAPNAIWAGGHGEAGSPIMEYILVRYCTEKTAGQIDAGVTSGDVLIWNELSGDGFTISKADSFLAANFAGVAVSNIVTVDSALSETVNTYTNNWGYMAIRGLCLAQIDVSAATNGQALVIMPVGATPLNCFGTQTQGLSVDIGTCLAEPAADGLGRVWLR